ncbi:hypothetical protein BC835DRAFT_1309427 [Cytidiella melzeri]|nr:hypothetical protein BC835DRAFT_1309427 [Cytidiella melzeri]
MAQGKYNALHDIVHWKYWIQCTSLQQCRQTLTVLVYLLALSVSAVLHQGDASQVWQSGVRTYPWFSTRQNLASAPSSPVRFEAKPFALQVKRPQPPPRQVTLDRDLEYGLERGVRVVPSYQPSRPAPRVPNQPVSSLYPVVLQSSLPPQQPAPEAPSWQPAMTVTPSTATDSARSARPTHPRKGSNGSGSRQRPIPPPLDLTRISAFKTIDGRVSRR